MVDKVDICREEY